MVGLKRISIDIYEEIHKEIKIQATKSNQSMRAYIIRALVKQLKEDSTTTCSSKL